LAELEINTLVPSFDTASTLPIGTGVTNEAVLDAVSKIARPALVPMKARTPAWSNTIEFGTPGRLIAVPTTGGVLLMSMGTIVLEVPAGGGNELVAYTVVVIGLFPFTVMPKRLL
jgi:protein-L-isoaspartate O-methyltransferase